MLSQSQRGETQKLLLLHFFIWEKIKKQGLSTKLEHQIRNSTLVPTEIING